MDKQQLLLELSRLSEHRKQQIEKLRPHQLPSRIQADLQIMQQSADRISEKAKRLRCRIANT